MTSGLLPDAAARFRGARSPLVLAGFVVLVDGTVLLSGGAGAGAGTDPAHTGQSELHPFREATVGRRPEATPWGELIRARRRLCNGCRARLFPGARPPSPAVLDPRHDLAD